MRNKLIIAMSMLLSLGLTGVAHADTSTITNTGPSSNNTVTFSNSFTQTVTNNNTSVVTNSNTQTGTTGDATVNDNTTGGSAISGNVTNTNGTTTSISINNAGGMGGGSNSNSSSNSSTPSSGGQGGGSGSAAEAQTLPRTGGGGINDMLLNALMNARQGVISPLAKTGADWSWSLTLLAGMLALAATYGYSKLQSRKFVAAQSQVI